jgi:hypothetical protein
MQTPTKPLGSDDIDNLIPILGIRVCLVNSNDQAIFKFNQQEHLFGSRDM